jgi:glycosyltransferase involved in cell wall biosynthesis
VEEGLVRVLLVTNLFQPEPSHLKGISFARELQRRGHDVHVLTGFPNYPGGRIYPGYRIRWTTEEMLEGVPITRVALYPSHDRSGLRRAATYVSLGASQALHCVAARRAFDVCHVSMGPLTSMWPAFVLRRLHGTRIVADVQDIWPESVTDSGMLRSRWAGRLLDTWSRRAYGAADRVIVLSPGYKRALVDRGVAAERIHVVYNWCEEQPSGPPVDGATLSLLEAGTFNVVYAGNLGRLQGIGTILDAAAWLARAEPNVRLVLVGDGVDAGALRERVQAEGISNVRMVGRLPVHETNAVLRRADLLLVHLDRRPLTRIGIPQKVQAYLAAGRPVLLAAEGDAAELLERSGAGATCPPSDPDAMAAAIQRFVRMSPEARHRLGALGRDFYRSELSFRRGVDHIERVYREVVGADVAAGAVGSAPPGAPGSG